MMHQGREGDKANEKVRGAGEGAWKHSAAVGVMLYVSGIDNVAWVSLR